MEDMAKKKKKAGPKILALDIEISPIIAHVWGLWENNVGLNQIQQDWHVLSWAAKWVGDKKVYYADQSGARDITNDKKTLEKLWKLMDEADIILTQNGKSFDIKKLNARFILNGMQPPSSFRQIDTKILAKRYFGFTSNKLEYMTDKLCVKYKKLKHKKFPGHEMWNECLKGNKQAWIAMKKYNIYDILSLEELYLKIAPWGTGINKSVYNDLPDDAECDNCGSHNLKKWGYRYTNTGKYQRIKCADCGAETKLSENLLTVEKRKSLKKL